MAKNTEHKLKSRREWIQVEVTQLQCPVCDDWFTPKQQPPRPGIGNCPKARCRVSVYRASVASGRADAAPTN